MTKTDQPKSATPITWERIADACPLLEDLLDTAKRMSRRSPGYCANRTWYRVMKPLMLREVGTEAVLECGRPHFILAADLDKPIPHDAECEAAFAERGWLKSSVAYDLAYDTLYQALPNCQHEGICY